MNLTLLAPILTMGLIVAMPQWQTYWISQKVKKITKLPDLDDGLCFRYSRLVSIAVVIFGLPVVAVSLLPLFLRPEFDIGGAIFFGSIAFCFLMVVVLGLYDAHHSWARFTTDEFRKKGLRKEICLNRQNIEGVGLSNGFISIRLKSGNPIAFRPFYKNSALLVAILQSWARENI